MNEVKIGLPIIGGEDWMGGVSYIELLTRAISTLPNKESIKLYLIVTPNSLTSYHFHKPFISLFHDVIFLGQETPNVRQTLDHFISCQTTNDLFHIIDFYFPAFIPMSDCHAAWIPDFQHRHLPDLFSKEMYLARDQMYSDLAYKSKVVVLSSHDALKDFKTFYPDSNAETKVLHFHTLPNDAWYKTNPIDIQKQYNLPDHYIICCNQFWKHKNHELLFKAIGSLKASGKPINLVCTGATSDYRFKDYFSTLQTLIKDNQIEDQVFILGRIPRDDQIQLIRRSQFVVQPSLFEGWSTVVEDARALGKPLLLSDLDVNKEQHPKHSVFFKRHHLQDLVEKISHLSLSTSPGPDKPKEERAKQESRALIEQYAHTFLDIATDSIQRYKHHNTAPLVSIITPSFNQNRFIQETIQSVLSQNYTNIEHIVVDGGSTDGTLDVLKEWSEKDTRFRFISEPDRGQSEAINKGLKMARGEIIGWLNSDDTYLPKAIDRMVKAFNQHRELDMIYGNAYITNEKNTIIRPYPTKKMDLTTLFDTCPISQPSAFIKKSVFDAVNGVDESLQFCMDYDLWIRLAKNGYQIGSIDSFIANSRWYSASKTGSQFVHVGFPEIIKTSLKHYGKVSKIWLNHFIEHYRDPGVFWFLKLFKDYALFDNTPTIQDDNRYSDHWAPPNFHINLTIHPQNPLHALILKGKNLSFDQLNINVYSSGQLIKTFTHSHGDLVMEIPINSDHSSFSVDIVTKERMVPAHRRNSSDTRELSFIADECLALSYPEFQFYKAFNKGSKHAIKWINDHF
ncbi:glycosyltransferase [Terrilactibacillus tamarindi]|uniref:glycosyltransferase n=1 Tax=Terrilactibacillus tamarindi TaxID=2599694 RepID=UPI0018AD17E4|nr:glycosyltransferase [Terrilactibacillus tamarindi]